MKLNHFKDIQFLPAIKALFNELKVPMNYVADEPTTAKEILKDTYKDNATFQLVDDVYFVGMVDDAAFEGNKSLDVHQIKSDYDGVLVFGITLHQRSNNLLPTRSQLAEISRAFNREFYYTPVVLVFKYNDNQADYLAFANTERLQYKQAWREGEKAGKVSLLRDINIAKPHRGHEDIIDQLRIPITGTKAVDSFAKLYTYWQEVFSVSVLNKKFYQELSNWYFWAVKHVTFPNKPTPEIAHQKNAKLEDLIQEHNATNVIRLLTRLLFTWFIKEKKLIPEALFDLDALQKDILNEISPYHAEGTMFAQANKESIYYKAILQNLFFASLNCPIEADGVDNRTRGFRGEGYGTHRGIDYLMRYKANFKNPEAFLKMMNQTVPFLNGGLFECLDDKYQNIYIDGFSDQMTKGEQLVVPDYLFFGVEEEVDLSTEYGVNNKGTKQAAVKGLINILKSYKFTITENTPIEEDVALDPELLGKVFENLLASYNPETKTTARKQTGSFYTPREIVNYMVDESLIAYLKNAVTDWNIDKAALDEELHELTSFDPGNPFAENKDLTKRIVKALDECKILDPACGSGAFPMGILQKMVHMLQKMDPENEFWKAVQIEKTEKELKDTLSIEDKKEREEKLKEINEAFDQGMNDPDYARKLYLIENCIYGVDIQPIANQISKLRFFISLVVDQKPTDNAKHNFGIRPLPNLETKFVTANTLIGIEKPKSQTTLFDTKEIKLLESELKKVRHKLFSARTKDTKLKYRQKDEELRKNIAEELIRSGWQNHAAAKLASWNPYDQNASSPFFDSEWMFDISDGFDIVIGNPPYVRQELFKNYKHELEVFFQDIYDGRADLYTYFIKRGFDILNNKGVLTLITSNKFIVRGYGEKIRNLLSTKKTIKSIVNFGELPVFKASVDSAIIIAENRCPKEDESLIYAQATENEHLLNVYEFISDSFILKKISELQKGWVFMEKKLMLILQKIEEHSKRLGDLFEIFGGIKTGYDSAFIINSKTKDSLIKENPNSVNLIKPWYRGKDIQKWTASPELFIIYIPQNTIDIDKYPAIKRHLENYRDKLENRATKQKWFELQQPQQRFTKLFESNKIIYSEIALEMRALLDVGKAYGTMKMFFIPYKPAILSILNSSVFDWYARMNFSSLGDPWNGGRLEFKTLYMSKVPIPDSYLNHDDLFEIMVKIITRCKQDKKESHKNQFEKIIDGLAMELYFPNHMKEQEIDVIYYLKKDIDKVLQYREFDSLSDSEKDKVIEQLHTTWSHPDNEVRNRMKLFAVRSPQILKPILES
ncbi:N-6 DNA methylase [Mangrovimonas sp. TPBH4]|uniref:Eco57I restriction-modification methylase domain-containing protein n=1 Tax=Mangrovimonas sp. TPBH4 TaxID=1645914 RepID=UPI0006B5B86C|nr:N-6 DNA methylase [Mangrovimonas sp. TPBH4]